MVMLIAQPPLQCVITYSDEHRGSFVLKGEEADSPPAHLVIDSLSRSVVE